MFGSRSPLLKKDTNKAGLSVGDGCIDNGLQDFDWFINNYANYAIQIFPVNGTFPHMKSYTDICLVTAIPPIGETPVSSHVCVCVCAFVCAFVRVLRERECVLEKVFKLYYLHCSLTLFSTACFVFCLFCIFEDMSYKSFLLHCQCSVVMVSSAHTHTHKHKHLNCVNN